MPKNSPGKNTHDVHLEILSSLGEKPDLPDPSGLLREAVTPTAIVAANVKVNEALNEVEDPSGL